MTLTTHALVGAAAASLFPEHPYLAFAAGFASHLAIDTLPHWDYKVYSLEKDHTDLLNSDMRLGKDFAFDLVRIGADGVCGFILSLFFMPHLLMVSPEIALVGAGAGIFPDVLQFVYFKTRLLFIEPLQRFHQEIQRGKSIYPHWSVGAGYQAIVVFLATIAAAVLRPITALI